MRRLALVLCVIAPTVAAAPAAENAWIALGPPSSTVFAAFLTLVNDTDHAIELIGASSTAFERVELHRTEQDGSNVRMRPVPKLELPAGARLALASGGVHLMLFSPRAPLQVGQRLTLTLRFADGTEIKVDAEVRDPRDERSAPHHHHSGAV